MRRCGRPAHDRFYARAAQLFELHADNKRRCAADLCPLCSGRARYGASGKGADMGGRHADSGSKPRQHAHACWEPAEYLSVLAL